LKTLFVVLLVFVALAALVLVALRRKGSGEAEGEWPFYAKRPLTAPEQVLYHRLVKALPEHIVLAQVQRLERWGSRKGSTSTSGTTASTA